jgi:general secretion pathway protein C
MQALAFGRSNLAPAALVWLPSLVATALLGLVLAYWSWQWFAPRVELRAEPAAAAGANIAAARGLFGEAPRKPSAAAPTGIAITLLGVAAASEGRRGYAVLQLEGKDILAVEEGEDVAPGVRLAEVRADHVILERGGVRETLAWPKRRATPAPVPRKAKR